MSKVSMGIEDVLFYTDLRRSVVPTIGGLPTFTRNGVAFGPSIEAHERAHMIDTPRIGPDGLLLELSQINLLASPFDVKITAPWNNTANVTRAAGTSRYEGHAANVLTSSSNNGFVGQTIGTLTAAAETLYFVVEESSADDIKIGIWDSTASGYVGQISFTWSTLALADVEAAQGTINAKGAVKLDNIGPNGGRVYLVWVTATPTTSGNGRQIFIHPDGATGTNSTIVHAAQHVDAALFTSPVVGTRATEAFQWNNGPTPQEWITYTKFINGNGPTAVLGERYWGMETASTDPRVVLFKQNATQYGVFFDNNVDVGLSALITMAGVAGDVIELLTILFTDGSQRIIGRKNGAAVIAAISASMASGLPTAWNSTPLALNSQSNGDNKAASKYEVLKFVKANSTHRATDGTDDEGLMAEMAGLFVVPDGKNIVSSKPFVEKSSNGTFATDLTGWTTYTVSGGTVTWTANGAKILRTATGGWQGLDQGVVLDSTKVYVLSAEVTEATQTNTTVPRVGVHTVVGNMGTASDTVEIQWSTAAAGETGVKKKKFTVSTTATYFLRAHSSDLVTGEFATIDNISLKEFDS